MNCPKCKTEMKLGKAIQPDMEPADTRAWGYHFDPPMINSETLQLIDVLKCPSCGHSDNMRQMLRMELKNVRTNLIRLRNELMARAFDEFGRVKDITLAEVVFKINSCLYNGPHGYPSETVTIRSDTHE